MLKSRKHVFWEALVVTILIFAIGFFLGMMFETTNTNKISNLYLRSEISLTDGLASSRITRGYNIDCEVFKKSNIAFADRVYSEAKKLEEIESVSDLTSGPKLFHKKYDLLRTILWTNNEDALKKCNNYNLIVYLYALNTENRDTKAEQNVWSRVLLDVKKELPEKVLLLPIAADQNLSSVELMMDKYKIKKLPAVLINNNEVLYEVKSKGEIVSKLNR